MFDTDTTLLKHVLHQQGIFFLFFCTLKFKQFPVFGDTKVQSCAGLLHPTAGNTSNIKMSPSEHSLDLCVFGPQLALRLTTCRPRAPAGTGALSWSSWSHQTVAVTTCVRPTTAAARTSISSASGQVLCSVLLPSSLQSRFFLLCGCLSSYFFSSRAKFS